MLLNISSFYTTHKSSVSTGFTEQIMPILRILCYNGSLDTWTVVGLTTANCYIAPLYGTEADPTENTAFNSSSIVVMGGCLTLAGILLTCLPAVIKQRKSLLVIIA
jgi:hypothetical protein